MKNILIILSFFALLYSCSSTSEESNKNSGINANIDNEFDFNVVNESVTDGYYYINKIVEKDSKYYIAVDYIKFLTGKESAEAAKNANIPDLGYYILNEDTQLKTFIVSDDIKISLLDIMSGKTIAGKNIKDVLSSDLSSLVAKITIVSGEIKELEQVFIP